MEKINTLYKGAGKGKRCVIISVTSTMTVSRNGIKASAIIAYKDFLEEYVQYDKVYILASANKVGKVDPMYGSADDVIFGIETPNLFAQYQIDDIFTVQHVLIFFGGYMPNYYFATCNRLCEWYENPNHGIFYNIQDDPDWITIDPALYCDKRIDGCKLRNNVKPYKYEDTPDARLYVEYNKKNTLHECFGDSVVAYCGTYYPLYFEEAPKLGFGSPNVVTEPKRWDNFFCHYWSGVNKYIDKKLTDFPFEGKTFDSMYYGYVKHDDNRRKITSAFYNKLPNKTLIYRGKKPFSEDFANIEERPVFEYNTLWETICPETKTTFIICNGSVYNCFIMQRYFDMMLGDIVPLIYQPIDKDKTYVEGDTLKDFMYVSTPEEFAEKVKMLSEDETLYRRIVYLQRKSVYKMFKEFMKPETIEKIEKKLASYSETN